LLTVNPKRVADSGHGERRLGNPMGSSPKTGTSPTVTAVRLKIEQNQLVGAL
jgi:hypothetical protein